MGDETAGVVVPCRLYYYRIHARLLLPLLGLLSVFFAWGCRHPDPKPRRNAVESLMREFPDTPEEKEFRDLKL